MRYVAIFLAALLVASGASAQLEPVPPPEQWRNYDGGADNFTVRVPGTVQKRPWSDTGFPAQHYLTGSVDETFSVTVVFYPPSIRGGATPQTIAERFATLMLSRSGVDKPTRDEAEACGGEAPGRAIEASLPDDLDYFARVCVTAESVYKVEAVINRDRMPAALPHVRAFLDSFRTRARLAPVVEPPAAREPAAAPSPSEPAKPSEPPPPVPAPSLAPAPSVTVPMPTRPKQ